MTTTETDTIKAVVGFHGHMCPGLAMGIRAAEVALAEIGPHAGDEEVVAIVETDMCGVDAVQFLTGCTFGKGNLIHRDYGKNVYTFVRRSDGRAVRISTRSGGWGGVDSERLELFGKVRAGLASPDERKRFFQLQQQHSEHILSKPVDEIYDVREVEVTPPPLARVLSTIDCDACDEPTMETRLRLLEGRQLCPPCFDAAVAGAVRVASPSIRR